jgi:hypothetical protein
MDRAKLGQKFGADYVLQVVLTDYGIREPGSAGLFRGRVQAAASVFDTSGSTGHGAVWRIPDIRASYPEDGRVLSRIIESIDAMRDEVERRFVEALVRKFHDYKVKREM